MRWKIRKHSKYLVMGFDLLRCWGSDVCDSMCD